MTYTLANADGTIALRSSDRAYVPWDTINSRPADYTGLAGQVWIAEGSPTASPYIAPPAKPREATGKQLCAALSDLGQLAAWDAAVMASTKPEDRYYWMHAYGATVPENNPKIARLAAKAGVTVSALFTKALTEPAI